MKIRINKFLSQCGITSRRGADVLIENKKVKINNKIAMLGDKVDSDKDIITIDGHAIKPAEKYVYYAVDKPVGYTSTVRDEYAEKTVLELVPKLPRVYPIGRLDKNSRGLIILTNDGDFANRITHPRYQHEKEYIVKLQITNNKSQINLKSQISKLKRGVKLSEGVARFDKTEIVKVDETRKLAIIKVVLHQGWKRQIRRMCERVGLEVLDLQRIRVGKLILGELKEGNYKKINQSDIL